MPKDPHTPRAALTGRAVLITGAARRVGATIARALHGAGANVVLHFRSSGEDAASLAQELNAARPGSAVLVECDLLEVAKLPALAETAAQAFGGLDILVNNASTFYPTPVGDITESDWDDLIGANLKAPLFLAQATAPALHSSRGLIVNLADIHGMRPLRRHPVYCVSKAGLIMLTKSLARELGPHVRVNAIAPGPVMWPEDGVDKELQAKIIDRTALKRPGSAADVARAVLFFATEAPYVTGQILAVDGGRSVGW
ncbi:MAG: pteridine reductase [Gammaproteobacteria bacterium]|nr:MAG: pteridine reductase [Gammaproteobacteria bacterium]TLY80834.1 MAG: pteridine reductase [Gammaproteobacteria bacterium]